MADLYFYDGQWFNSEDEIQEHLEQRYQKAIDEGLDEGLDDCDWMFDR